MFKKLKIKLKNKLKIMKSSKKTKVIKNRFKLRPIEEKARRGRVTETEKALTGFLDELKNVYCDNCEAINPN